MAERGMGRGLAAILQVSGQHGDRPELREISIELVEPNPSQPRRRFDEEALDALAASLAENGVLQPILVRPRDGRPLRAGRRRAPLARGAARGARGASRDRRASRRRVVARGGDRREHGARGPQPGRGGARRRRPGRGARAHARGGRPPGRPQPRRRVEPAAPARPAGRRADAARVRSHHRGPRPRRAARRGRGRTAPARQGRGRRRLVGPRHRGPRAQGQRGPRLARTGAPAPHPDQVAACEEIAETLALALGREVRVRPRGTAYKVEFAVDGPGRRAGSSRCACGASRSPDRRPGRRPRYTARSQRAISSVG